MITKFKVFEYNELDPWGEEDWENDRIYTIEDLKVGDKIFNTSNPDTYGKIIKIEDDTITLGKNGNEWHVSCENAIDWIERKICGLEKGINEKWTIKKIS